MGFWRSMRTSAVVRGSRFNMELKIAVGVAGYRHPKDESSRPHFFCWPTCDS
jgi:hypothetical protein